MSLPFDRGHLGRRSYKEKAFLPEEMLSLIKEKTIYITFTVYTLKFRFLLLEKSLYFFFTF